LSGLIKKGRLESSCRREHAYCTPQRISKNRLYSSQQLNYLEEVAMIIMDNASYYSTIINNVPNTGPHKKDIQE
jgi:hypothetical protein